MGSDDARQFRGCMSSLSWPARWLSFQDSSASCEIAVRAVTSPIASGMAVAVPRPDHAATDQISTHNVVQHRASLMGSPAAALTRFHVTLVAVVALATVVALRDWGWPAPTSSYGRYYWLNRVLTPLLRQLPYAIAFIRTWKAPDRIGLALAVVAGATPVLLTLFTHLQYAVSAGPVAVAECFAWSRRSGACIPGMAATPFRQRRWRCADFYFFRLRGLHVAHADITCDSLLSRAAMDFVLIRNIRG